MSNKEILKDDIKSITVMHPRCPKCGQDEKTNKFQMIPYGGAEWHASGVMKCLECDKKFTPSDNKAVIEA